MNNSSCFFSSLFCIVRLQTSVQRKDAEIPHVRDRSHYLEQSWKSTETVWCITVKWSAPLTVSQSASVCFCLSEIKLHPKH